MIKLILYSPSKIPSPQDGLPFWLFWFLLSFLGLLILFLFLRNKELRRKIDSSFHYAKKYFLRLHLKQQIRKKEKRKERLWWELGKTIYEYGLAIEGVDRWLKNIKDIERKKDQLLAQSPFRLNKKDKAKSWENNVFFAWPQKWKKKSHKLMVQFKELEEQFHSELIKLGQIAATQRSNQEKLIPFYEKIDALESTLDRLEKRLHSL